MAQRISVTFAILLLTAVAGCCRDRVCGCLTKRLSEEKYPTDIRQMHWWCAGEDALMKFPCGPDRDFHGHKPTCWREWDAPGAVWRDMYCPRMAGTFESYKNEMVLEEPEGAEAVPSPEPDQPPESTTPNPFRNGVQPLPNVPPMQQPPMQQLQEVPQMQTLPESTGSPAADDLQLVNPKIEPGSPAQLQQPELVVNARVGSQTVSKNAVQVRHSVTKNKRSRSQPPALGGLISQSTRSTVRTGGSTRSRTSGQPTNRNRRDYVASRTQDSERDGKPSVRKRKLPRFRTHIQTEKEKEPGDQSAPKLPKPISKEPRRFQVPSLRNMEIDASDFQAKSSRPEHSLVTIRMTPRAPRTNLAGGQMQDDQVEQASFKPSRPPQLKLTPESPKADPEAEWLPIRVAKEAPEARSELVIETDQKYRSTLKFKTEPAEKAKDGTAEAQPRASAKATLRLFNSRLSELESKPQIVR